ncbi:MAG: recombinase zinc beta ribbon domain-containing protein [Actinomycetota bacterium]
MASTPGALRRNIHVRAFGGVNLVQNPRYTGRQVWNKQRRDEVLVDVEDVALGHETKQRWNLESDWIYSETVVHEAIVDDDTFKAAQDVRGSRSRYNTRAPKKTGRAYALSGLVFCSECGRRMSGHFTNGHVYYRCRFPQEYGLATGTSHPKSVYLREDLVLPKLDEWLAQLFAPDNIVETSALLAAAEDEVRVDFETEKAQREISDCDQKLEKLRRALEEGVDPHLVGRWIDETQKQRDAAVRRTQRSPSRSMSAEEIRSAVEELGSALNLLGDADPRSKCDFYAALGLKLHYFHGDGEARVEVQPAWAYGCVGGGT